jgi:predicted TIM-barrel fold metal-dependent hydrolase
MRNGKIIIDAVGHTYDLSDDNRREHIPVEALDHFIAWLYGWGHAAMESTKPGYMLSLDEFRGGWTTEELVRLFFVESDVDIVAMHSVDFFDLFKRGANPWEQSLALKQAAPDRVLLYASCNPLTDRGAEFERMAQRAAEGTDAFKFYPVNGLRNPRGAPISYSFADEDVFSFFEHANNLGVKHIAVHKAVPTSPGSVEQDRPDDVTAAAAAFPDMTFEVVHSGWAFLEDCAMQMHLNANIYANLECTANTAVRMPRRFAKSVGALIAAAPDRVLFGTGAPLGHPQPIIEAIEAFEMPEDLLEEGLPEFTDEIKAGLLGENMARMHGLDIEEIKQRATADEFARRRQEYLKGAPSPWQLKRERVGSAAGSPA